MAFEDMEHKSLKKLIQLCLLVSVATLGVVVYGTFYQNASQKAALDELQGAVVRITNFNPSSFKPTDTLARTGITSKQMCGFTIKPPVDGGARNIMTREELIKWIEQNIEQIPGLE